MLTIFTIPKAFRGHIEIIQRNAFQSWRRAVPGCQVILFGADAGTQEVAAEMGFQHIAHLRHNRYGTPLLSDAFAAADRMARFDTLMFVNADILLFPNLVTAIRRIRLPAYLVVGQRWDVEVNELLDFTTDDWARSLENLLKQQGQLHPPNGSDYFIFRRGGVFRHLPPFAVGRPGWDNWMIDRAIEVNIPVIDATRAILVGHQNHGYSHVPQARGIRWEGPEADANRRRVRWMFTLEHATHRMDPHHIARLSGRQYLRQWWRLFPARYPLLRRILNTVSIMLGRRAPGLHQG